MTDGELAAIEERCNAATPGPWNWNGDEIYGVHGDDVLSIEAIPFSMYGEQLYFGDGVLPFVLAARTDVPALIAEVRRLRSAMRETFVQGAIYERARTTACGPQPANGYLANLARCEAFRRWPDGEVSHE